LEYLAYLLGFVVSVIGRHAGGAAAHRIITGHYVSWWGGLVGLIKGAVGSVLAVVPSLGVLWLLLGSHVSTWPAFVVAGVYPITLAVLALLVQQPDKLDIAQRRATIKSGLGIHEPYSRSAFDREVRELDEEYKRELLWLWGQLAACVGVMGVAATVWSLAQGSG